jgi:hypothetical protein
MSTPRPLAEANRIVAEVDGTTTLQNYIERLQIAVYTLKTMANVNERRLKRLMQQITDLSPEQRRELSRRLSEGQR